MSPISFKQDQVLASRSLWNLCSVGLFGRYIRYALRVRTSAWIQSATRLTSSASTWSPTLTAFSSGEVFLVVAGLAKREKIRPVSAVTLGVAASGGRRSSGPNRLGGLRFRWPGRGLPGSDSG